MLSTIDKYLNIMTGLIYIYLFKLLLLDYVYDVQCECILMQVYHRCLNIGQIRYHFMNINMCPDHRLSTNR